MIHEPIPTIGTEEEAFQILKSKLHVIKKDLTVSEILSLAAHSYILEAGFICVQNVDGFVTDLEPSKVVPEDWNVDNTQILISYRSIANPDKFYQFQYSVCTEIKHVISFSENLGETYSREFKFADFVNLKALADSEKSVALGSFFNKVLKQQLEYRRRVVELIRRVEEYFFLEPEVTGPDLLFHD
jgi:hypothetical protein